MTSLLRTTLLSLLLCGLAPSALAQPIDACDWEVGHPSDPDRVGPGTYDTHLRIEMPRSSPGSSAFASGVVRSVPDPMNRGRTAEPGYSTLATDRAQWHRHANRQAKGFSFSQTQRWQRPAGPGSNRPSERGTPGPGAYGRLHAWPQGGFRGSAHGYNHNAAVG